MLADNHKALTKYHALIKTNRVLEVNNQVFGRKATEEILLEDIAEWFPTGFK